MSKISLLVCSRISGNKNWALLDLLEGLKQMSANYENFEVLIKFDSDDRKVRKVLPELHAYPFRIKYIIEPRGRGYMNLHVFYNRLFSLADEESVVIGAMADDFEIIQKGWDQAILSKTNLFRDQIFIIHGRPHPPYYRENYQEQKFYLDLDIINSLEDFYIIDEAPLWSRKLLQICGGFNYVPFTDAWTLLVEYYLFHRFGINRTIFLEQPIIHRKLNEPVDRWGSRKWLPEREDTFSFVRSGFYQTLVEQQALNIYSHIKMSELAALPPPLVPKKLDISVHKQQPPVLSQHSKRTALNLFPSLIRPSLITLYRAMKIPAKALYLRLSFVPYLTKTKRDHESIMGYLDSWVFKHGAIGYVPEDFVPGRVTSVGHGIQQVRREISEFVRLLLLKDLDNSILEIGLGYHGGTHMLWRRIFKRVITIEVGHWLVKKFKLIEWLDSRSTFIVGRAEDPSTIEKVRRHLDHVDVLFLDGDHTYEGVAKNYTMYRNLVRPGGIIAFHDSICTLHHCGVAKFLEDLSAGVIDGKRHALHSIVYSDHLGISYEEC